MDIETMIGAATSVFSMTQQSAAASAQKHQLELKRQQNELQASEQSEKESDQVLSVLSSQKAQLGASGFSPSSQGFFAIQKDTFNKYAEDQKLRDANKSIVDNQIEDSINQTKDASIFGIAGAALNAGLSMNKQKRLDKLLGNS